MGFVRRKIFLLKFADPEFEGLQVRAKQASVDQLTRSTELGEITGTTREKMAEIIGLLAEGVVSWNLEEPTGRDLPDGTAEVVPVPCTAEGMWTQDGAFLADILRAWLRASAGVSPPLPSNSPDGDLLPEVDLPMDRLPVSQLS